MGGEADDDRFHRWRLPIQAMDNADVFVTDIG